MHQPRLGVGNGDTPILLHPPPGEDAPASASLGGVGKSGNAKNFPKSLDHPSAAPLRSVAGANSGQGHVDLHDEHLTLACRRSDGFLLGKFRQFFGGNFALKEDGGVLSAIPNSARAGFCCDFEIQALVFSVEPSNCLRVSNLRSLKDPSLSENSRVSGKPLLRWWGEKICLPMLNDGLRSRNDPFEARKRHSRNTDRLRSCLPTSSHVTKPNGGIPCICFRMGLEELYCRCLSRK